MSVALHGNLRDFGIAEVFQLIGQQRKTGTLVVGEGGDSVFLTFDEGPRQTGWPTSAALLMPPRPQISAALRCQFRPMSSRTIMLM